MGWIEPVFDRNNDDLAFQKKLTLVGWKNLTDEQRTQWIDGLKGSFNFVDANRIENNCKFISDIYGGFFADSDRFLNSNLRSISAKQLLH